MERHYPEVNQEENEVKVMGDGTSRNTGERFVSSNPTLQPNKHSLLYGNVQE